MIPWPAGGWPVIDVVTCTRVSLGNAEPVFGRVTPAAAKVAMCGARFAVAWSSRRPSNTTTRTFGDGIGFLRGACVPPEDRSRDGGGEAKLRSRNQHRTLHQPPGGPEHQGADGAPVRDLGPHRQHARRVRHPHLV